MLYVNCYNPVAPLLDLKSLGWSGARRDIRSSTDAMDRLDAHARAGFGVNLLINAEPEPAADLAILILLDMKLWLAPTHVAIEVGNEWDRKYDPARAHRAWEDVAEVAPAYTDIRIVTGGISNLGRDALSWLSEALPARAANLVCGFHGYTGNKPLVKSERADQLRALRDVIGSQEAWNTETGWHQASVARDFPLCFLRDSLSEIDVLNNLKADVEIHALYDVHHYCVYQLNDGRRDTPEDRFGIRTIDGRWKEQATLPSTLLRCAWAR